MEDEISDGVKILCDRMESNPEDFLDPPYDPNTFDRKLGKFYYDGKHIEALAKGDPDAPNVYWYLSDAEKQALIVSYVRMIRAEHTRTVVERLLDTEQKKEPDVKFKGRGPLTRTQIVNDSLQLMKQSFDEAYAKNHETDAFVFRTKGRYATGWDGHPLTDPWKKNK